MSSPEGPGRAPAYNTFLTNLTPQNTSGDNRFSSFLLLVLMIYLLKAHKDNKNKRKSEQSVDEIFCKATVNTKKR